MQVSVQVHPTAASALHDETIAIPEVEDLRGQLLELGLRLTPMHPGETDPQLAVYFTVELPDDVALSDRVLAILHDNTAVTAAYKKPLDEPAQG